MPTERHHFSIFSVFMQSGNASPKISEKTPLKSIKSGGVQLDYIRPKAKSRFTLYPL
jgi:hypothetical protein